MVPHISTAENADRIAKCCKYYPHGNRGLSPYTRAHNFTHIDISDSLQKENQETLVGILVEGEKIVGVKTSLGIEVRAKTVVLTNGTFLNGLIHIGEKQFGGGRAGERAAHGITKELVDLGFESGRMKTGTPPRVDGRSLDFSKMIVQPGDVSPEKFSYLKSTKPLTHQRDCHMSHTSLEVHDLLREGFDRSPMFNGAINSVGPRYCPSIEDKINRFADKDSHQLFVEPEGWDTVEYYVNGFSTSLPEDVQFKALRGVKGFENVKFFRPGYAIEYDFFPPTQLRHTLETKNIKGLFFAGQINGTTGYEEAAARGLMAGINAALSIRDQETLVLDRAQAYIGVMIDDLVTKGVAEPYRMFTSRAEYRLSLRADNADRRLTQIGIDIGLVGDERKEKFLKKINKINELDYALTKLKISPNKAEKFNIKVAKDGIKRTAFQILSREGVTFDNIRSIWPELPNASRDEEEQLEISAHYSGYLEKQEADIIAFRKDENLLIPENIDYDKLSGLSNEVKSKFKLIKPKTMGQALRIDGITPAAAYILLSYVKKKKAG